VSEFVQRLRRQAKELNALERDLRADPEEPIDWARTTMSSAVAGLGNPVERAFLADYFLTTWTEWRGLYERYPRYFGRPEESLPHQWHQTAHQCRHLADRLFRDDSLGRVLADTWAEQEGQSGDVMQPGSADGPDAAVLYRSAVRNYLRLNTLAGRDASRNFVDGAWGRCADVAHRADAQCKGLILQASPTIREAVLWHLRHYRHAALALSWLDGTPVSALDHLLREDRPMLFAMEERHPAFRLRGENAEEVRRVLLRIQQAIAEIGYNSFLEDVTSTAFVGGRDSPLGGPDVMLVPGPARERLSTILVGITKGSRKGTRLGFPRVMQQLQALLSQANGRVLFVLVLCDSWDSEGFRSQHLPEIRKFAAIPFLFLLVGSPDSVVAPVAIEGGNVSGAPV
jgi:hypothetical protein